MIKYPKNYHANGYGWHNLAAMGYAKPPPPPTSAPAPAYPSSSPYPLAALSMPPLPGAAPMYGGPAMPPLPGSMSSMSPYPAPAATGVQLSYGFAGNVMPSQIPNAPHHGHVSNAAPPVAPPQHASTAPGIGWAIGGLGDSTDSGVTHDPHQAQQEAKYESIYVPFEDRSLYSNMRFFDVSTYAY